MTTTHVHVRRARETDLPRISEISRAAYLDGGHLVQDSRYLTVISDAEARMRGGELFVAEVDGAVAGSVVLARAEGDFAELARPGELEFRVLAVDPAFQGRGVGRALVRHLLRLAAEDGAEAMVICSMDTMVAAHALYIAEGFVRRPDRDLVIDGIGRFPTFVHLLRQAAAGAAGRGSD